ncbi:DoxX family protein [Acaryochloris marina NIES-2412]|uniref:DoxX family protein n=1 Tax=Acaryochloris marina TaxID=155978 RepID=UPI004058E37E
MNKKTIARWLLALGMITVGTLHWLTPRPFVQMISTFLPYPLELVYISGFFEILGGVGLLIPRVSRAAAWGLILLFIAVFPANINMAVNDLVIDGLPHNLVAYWLRLPLQGVLIAWAWWFTKPDLPARSNSTR